MCVKLVKKDKLIPYDIDRPLETQMDGLQKIVVNYQPKDAEVGKFIEELERFSKTGINFSFSVEVKHNDNLSGFKAKKKISQLENDININEIIKLMAITHKCADQKLEEMVNLCVNKECNGEQKA